MHIRMKMIQETRGLLAWLNNNVNYFRNLQNFISLIIPCHMKQWTLTYPDFKYPAAQIIQAW